jgi:predicted N-formylglutamate amidohydrolase
MKLIITCEHGGNHVPKKYQPLFNEATHLLESHEAIDFGALKLAKALAPLASYFFYTEITRLLVELNRSPHHPKLFSSFTKGLSLLEKKRLLEKYYYPYRNHVFQTIQNEINKKEKILHLSVHSFTPVFNSILRKVDIGLLYDPKRAPEKLFCHEWKRVMRSLDSNYRVRFNQPYLGIADGLVTYLRKQFSAESYVGIELEVNQSLLCSSDYLKIKDVILNSFSNLLT